MINEYLNFIVFLENTLATYYAKIKNFPRLEGARSILEFMEVHSFEHGQLIEEIKKNHPKPAVRESTITDFQNKLTKSVFAKVSEEKDILKVLELMADSEESIGKLYHTLSDMMLKLAEHYTTISGVIEKIAHEEFDHRDLLLKDKERLAKKIDQK